MLLCLGTTPTVQRSMFFEHLSIDEVNRAGEVRDYASGKSINVARVAHQLGHKVLATGFAGGDRGKFLLHQLERDGVPHEFIEVQRETRLCTTVVDRSAGTATELVEEHAAVEPRAWDELSEKLRLIGPGARGWVLSGSVAPGGGAGFYAECVVAARSLGASVIILDARGAQLNRARTQPGFVAKMNLEELAMTVGVDSIAEATRREALLSIVPADGAAVVTNGAKEAFATDGSTFWRIRPPKVKAISAVGSGDAFSAGLAIGLLEGKNLGDACAYGAACGAANAMTPYAGFVEPAQVEQLLARVVVEKW